MLPGVRGLRGPLSCLNEARFGILLGRRWAPARACYEAALDYAKTRVQFGKPIAGFQLTQRKLVDMMVELQKGQLLAAASRPHEGRRAAAPAAGQLRQDRQRPRGAGLAREARTILGANGITLEYPVIRHMNNLESVLTYEGTNEIHTLVLGEALTGERALM